MTKKERTLFTNFTGDGAEIIRHPDGAVTFETEADYGDTDMGWGTARATIHMNSGQVKEFIAFLQEEV